MKQNQDKKYTITIYISSDVVLPGTIKVSWRIKPLTAKAPEDYVDSAGDLSFGPGIRNATISIQLTDDNIPELNKTFQVELYDAKDGGKISI